ncbi:MAG: hypothetical protein QM831_01960 [Kofleriaceae bacterium]
MRAFVLLLVAGHAHADESAPHVALAANNPLYWSDSDSHSDDHDIAVSAYVGVTQTVAIRASFSTYTISPRWVQGIGECNTNGRFNDESIGVQWYVLGLARDWDRARALARRFDGLFVEGDVLRRANPNEDDGCEAIDEMADVQTHSVWYGGRALVGYTITPLALHRNFFLSIGAGVSIGGETGHETTTPAFGGPSTTVHIDRAAVAPEWLFRIGVAI